MYGLSSINSFYRNIHNLFLGDAVVLIANLLDQDARPISLFHYDKLKSDDKKILKEIEKIFSKASLKEIRNQILSHQDSSNHSNNIPHKRTTGWLSLPGGNEILSRIINLIISILCRHENLASNYFEVGEELEGLRLVMSQTKPTLTDIQPSP